MTSTALIRSALRLPGRKNQPLASSVTEIWRAALTPLAPALFSSALFSTAIAISVVNVSPATAGEHCDRYQPSCSMGVCDCGGCGVEMQPIGACDARSGARRRFLIKQTPVYRTLDAVAGGIERVLGLDQCGDCNRGACDSACDAAVFAGETLGMPQAPPVEYAAPHASNPSQPSSGEPRLIRPRLPSVPLPEIDAPPMRMGEPKIVAPERTPTPLPRDTELDRPNRPSGPPRSSPSEPPAKRQNTAPTPLPKPAADMPNAEQLPQPKQTPSLPARAAERSGANEQPANEQPANEQPQAKPRAKEDGSIFDALEDPFGDDGVDEGTPFDETTPTDARPRRSYQPLFQRDGASLPRRSNPATQMGAGGTGRGAIGSGLRPVDNNVPLRPVSHEAPVELPPMSRTRVLAPYRPARSQ